MSPRLLYEPSFTITVYETDGGDDDTLSLLTYLLNIVEASNSIYYQKLKIKRNWHGQLESYGFRKVVGISKKKSEYFDISKS